MKASSDWNWSALILIVLLLMITSCCVGTWFGGLVGFSMGKGITFQRSAPIPEPEFMPSVPEWPETPEIPEVPELPEFPDDFWEEDARPWLGVAFRMVDEGALVVVIVPDSPAEDIGLYVGDIITEVNGRRVTATVPLDEHILRYEPGDRITLTLLRDGREHKVDVRLGTRPAESQPEPMWDG